MWIHKNKHGNETIGTKVYINIKYSILSDGQTATTQNIETLLR